MAGEKIIQSMILQPGQSQDDRPAEALGVHFADVDQRTAKDFLLFTKDFAKYVNFYKNNITTPAGDWTKFFPYDEATVKTLLSTQNGTTTPHLALFLAFLEMYKKPQGALNGFTGRHLDFYYKDVLRLVKKTAVPDNAHVLLELKKNSSPITISPNNIFSAGKDNTGVELLYTPTGETVINTSAVDSLRSIFLDSSGKGTVRAATVANSSDGIGGELTEDEPKWYGFGYAGLPAAEVGFAIASPVLRMQEGMRKVTVTLTLSSVDPAQLYRGVLAEAFDVTITGEKGWLGPYTVLPTLSTDGVLVFSFRISDTEKAVIDYDPEIHGKAYIANAPILQVLLKADSTVIGYNNFKGVTLQKAKIAVDVSGMASLNLESDAGALDSTQAFLPWGAEPTEGSRFKIGCAEALGKKLSELEVAIQWKGVPAADLGGWYTGYETDDGTTINNSYFTAATVFKDAGGWNATYNGQTLFEDCATDERQFVFPPSVRPRPSRISYKTFTDFITFWLEQDFLHSDYRKTYAEKVINKGIFDDDIALPHEPYTPTIQEISLSYTAESDEVNTASTDATDFSNPDIQFFHVAYFGQMREGGYQRDQVSFLTDKSVPLLPAYENEGELLIGLSNLSPGDSVSVLFEVAEGSADPDLAQEDITWSVLCDNYWMELDTENVVLDTTNQLLTSGIIKFVIPAEATTTNTILPTDLIWLRASVAQNVTAVSQLIQVAANAVEVQFTDQGNDPTHLDTALPKGSITKLKNSLSAVKTVSQPYASFDGSAEETDDTFYLRVSERLRHKDRCITPWDYERMILEAYPSVHKVKCIPHAREGSWLAPGYVMIIVVPDLTNQNAIDPLQPKVDADTISSITEFVQEHTGMQVQLTVKNPTYQKIRLDFKVKFRAGYEFNYYSGQLKTELIKFLSPWAYESDSDISFGETIYKSVLLNFVEDLQSVDYLTDFYMYSYVDVPNTTDLSEAQAETPDAILVSDSTHDIQEVT
jgi:hypothetical protein